MIRLDACNLQFTVYYGRIWPGLELIGIQGIIELILRDEQVTFS